MAQFMFDKVRFVTSPERDKSAELRKEYIVAGLGVRRSFLDGYPSFKTADELFQSFPKTLEAALDAAVEMVSSDLAAHRIYDVSQVTLRSELRKRMAQIEGGFQRIHDRYHGILLAADELDARQQEATANRGRIIGGGFGVEGAAKGIAMTAVANAAIDLTHGLANLTAKAASAIGDDKKKRELLDAIDTKETLGDFLFGVVLQGHDLVATLVNRSADERAFDTVSDEDAHRSAAIVENVTSSRVPEVEVKLVLVQALTLNPFNDAAWTAWLDLYGDSKQDIASAARELGIDTVQSHKAHLIERQKASLRWTTPEECSQNLEILGQYAAWLGFPFDGERDQIARLSTRLELERRTFNGKVYSTAVEAMEAKNEYEDEVQRTVAGVVYETHDAANYVRDHDRASVIYASTSSGTIGWMTLAFRRFPNASGRSSRKEFFMFMVFVAFVFTACLISVVVFGSTNPSGGVPLIENVTLIFLAIFLISSFVVGVLVQIRRFHDQDRSGWFVLLNVIPYIGWLIVGAFMLVDGTASDNRYGPPPKAI